MSRTPEAVAALNAVDAVAAADAVDGVDAVLLADPVVTGIATELGRTPAQVVIRWHLQQGNIVIPKSVTPERIVSNFDVVGFELSGDQVAAISGLDRAERTGPDPDVFG